MKVGALSAGQAAAGGRAGGRVRPGGWSPDQLGCWSGPLQLVFPPGLSARQRTAIHAIGEQNGLQHESAGDGAARHIVLGPACAPCVPMGGAGGATGRAESDGDGGQLTDKEIIDLIQEHLSIDAAPVFEGGGSKSSTGGQQPSACRARTGPKGKAGKGSQQLQPSSKGMITVEDFIEQVCSWLPGFVGLCFGSSRWPGCWGGVLA